MTPAPTTGNLSASLGDIFGILGLTGAGTQATVHDIVTKELGGRASAVTITGPRHGVLSLHTNPRTAQFLTYESDRILLSLSERAPGTVTAIRIVSRA